MPWNLLARCRAAEEKRAAAGFEIRIFGPTHESIGFAQPPTRRSLPQGDVYGAWTPPSTTTMDGAAAETATWVATQAQRWSGVGWATMRAAVGVVEVAVDRLFAP